jgi:hypothetical protein
MWNKIKMIKPNGETSDLSMIPWYGESSIRRQFLNGTMILNLTSLRTKAAFQLPMTPWAMNERHGFQRYDRASTMPADGSQKHQSGKIATFK